ncbi:hypothetical protein N782_12090 [Pontibacillus yanchengensis Y32]|uniref:Uncharacterized protein n=1 Tax=Pontibacillus yanchengensis Y32 TaxID=1385514 RepID=A0A0A2TT36_9BACI|nr:hypothetical protein N782_12090 [Pontibacillus yanchengensis Y32]
MFLRGKRTISPQPLPHKRNGSRISSYERLWCLMEEPKTISLVYQQRTLTQPNIKKFIEFL